jgi:muconolactone D-isomerase
MLFHVEMTVNVPPDMDSARLKKLQAAEKAMSQDLQAKGIWRHIWRIAGRYANVGVFEVESPAQLHDLLFGLPLFPTWKSKSKRSAGMRPLYTTVTAEIARHGAGNFEGSNVPVRPAVQNRGRS